MTELTRGRRAASPAIQEYDVEEEEASAAPHVDLDAFADGVAVSDHWPVLARLRAPKRKPSI